jgi:hypothetical protein
MSQYKKLYEQELKKFNTQWVMQVMKELQPKDLKSTELKDWKERASQIPFIEKLETLEEHIDNSYSYDHYSCKEDLVWFKLMFENDTIPYMARTQSGQLYSILKTLVFNSTDEPYEINDNNKDIIDFFLSKTEWEEWDFEQFMTKYCERFHHSFTSSDSSIFPLLQKNDLYSRVPQEAMNSFCYDVITAFLVDEQILNLALIEGDVSIQHFVDEYEHNENKNTDDFDYEKHSFYVYEPIIDQLNYTLKNSDNLMRILSPRFSSSFNDELQVHDYLNQDKLSQVILQNQTSEKEFKQSFLVPFLNFITSKQIEKLNTSEIIDFSSDYLEYYNNIAKQCNFSEISLPKEYAKTKFFAAVNTLLEKNQLETSIDENNQPARKIKL